MKINRLFLIIGGTVSLLAMASCSSREIQYDASGTFEATEVIVSAEANGKITGLEITEGDVLNKGQQVGSIDSVQLYLKKLQLIAGNQALQSRRLDQKKQIASLQEQISTAKRERNRVQNLLKDNAATQKQLDDANSILAVLEKQLAATQSTIDNTNNGLSNDSKSMLIQVDQIEDQLRKCHITSPIAGTVLSKYTEAGELATVGKALFRIADVKNMTLRAYLTSDQINKLKIGQQVKVYADNGQGYKEYPGSISWVSDKAEFTPKTIQTRDERANLVYAVKIHVVNDGNIKIGMYGEVKF